MKEIFEKIKRTAIWRKLFSKACDDKEYVKVEKNFLKGLLIFMKESAMEGNCGATMFIKKYKENEEWTILKK